MKNINKKSNLDLILNGNIQKMLFIIIFPLFLNRFFNTFYNFLDQLMVSEISDTSVSAVTIINQVKNFLACIGAGLAAGSGIYISRKFGEGKTDEARKVASLAFVLQLFSCAILLTLFPFTGLILKATKVPTELLTKSNIYFMIQIFELILIAINDFFAMIERVKGNTKIILILNFSAMGLKIALNATFIYGFKVDSIVFVEIASIIAQSLITIFAFFRLFSKSNIFQINFKLAEFKKEHIKNIAAYSIPLIFSKSIIDLGKVIFNSICAEYGALCVGALGISNTLTGIASSPTEAIKDSESSIISANIGNKNVKRSLKVFRNCLLFSAIWAFVSLFLIKDVFLDEIVGLFSTKNTSEQFIFTIKEIFSYDWVTIPAIVFCNACTGVLLGFGKTFMATILNAVRITFRIGTILIFKTFFPSFGQTAIGIATGISNVAMMTVSAITLIIFIIVIKKKGFKGIPA